VGECGAIGNVVTVCGKRVLPRGTVHRLIKRQRTAGAKKGLSKDTHSKTTEMSREAKRLGSEMRRSGGLSLVGTWKTPCL